MIVREWYWFHIFNLALRSLVFSDISMENSLLNLQKSTRKKMLSLNIQTMHASVLEEMYLLLLQMVVSVYGPTILLKIHISMQKTW